MKLSQFKFKLPEDKIALHPAKYRDESRLMVVHKSKVRLNTRYSRISWTILMIKMCLSLMIRKFSLRVCMEIRKRPVPVSRYFCCAS